MTWIDISLLLTLLGASCLAAAWLGRKSDDVRDTIFVTLIGGGKVALAIGLWLTTSKPWQAASAIAQLAAS